MADELNRSCPFCGKKLKADIYRMERGKIEYCAYCDGCNQFCTDSTAPSKAIEQLRCIEEN